MHNLTSQFFSAAVKYSGPQVTKQKSQYINQKQSQYSQSLFDQVSGVDQKLTSIFSNQSRLNSLSDDTSIFASTQDQISHLNIIIKDTLTEIQVRTDDILKTVDNRRHQSWQQQDAIQVCVKILDSRTLKATAAFKAFLQKHQVTIKKQEEKKEKLTGKNGKSNRGFAAAKKMKILPSHYGNGNRSSNNSAYSTVDSDRGDTVLHMAEEQYDTQRTSSIQNIENILHDVSSVFKRFAQIVQEHSVLVERIDTNTENALHDLEGAKKEIREIYEDTKSTRKLVLKLFFILMLFSTFYILFVL